MLTPGFGVLPRPCAVGGGRAVGAFVLFGVAPGEPVAASCRDWIWGETAPYGVNPRIRLRATWRRGGEALLKVSDPGAGFAESLLCGGDLLLDLGELLARVLGVAEASVVAEFALVPVSGVEEITEGCQDAAVGGRGLRDKTPMFGVAGHGLAASEVVHCGVDARAVIGPAGEAGDRSVVGGHRGDDRLPFDGPAGERLVGAVHDGPPEAEASGAVEHRPGVRVRLGALGGPRGQQPVAVVLDLDRDDAAALVEPIAGRLSSLLSQSVALFERRELVGVVPL